ncbi:MAG: hypothetical protein HKN10_18215 [Myxococcales bacterium]|nr:hypothetical protein [Myxococcales bacterium]
MNDIPDFYAIAVIFALGVALAFLYERMDRKIWSRSNAIMTGVLEGLPISIEYRYHLLRVGFFLDIGILVLVMSAGAGGFVLLGRSVGSEYVRIYAYFNAFIAACSVGWLMQTPSWYRMLRSHVRKAEAD